MEGETKGGEEEDEPSLSKATFLLPNANEQILHESNGIRHDLNYDTKTKIDDGTCSSSSHDSINDLDLFLHSNPARTSSCNPDDFNKSEDDKGYANCDEKHNNIGDNVDGQNGLNRTNDADDDSNSNVTADLTSENSSGNTESQSTPFSFCALKREQKVVLALSFFTDLLIYLSLSILAPFFPEEAKSKNISDTVSGWVFGVFALIQFLFSPVIGKLMPKLGSRFVFLSGLFMTGGCTVLFGFLHYVPVDDGGTVFITLSFIIRIVLAIGCTAQQTASILMIMKFFPDNMMTVFGMGEIFVGIGMVSGPAIGGFLYASGGFMLPFALIGGLAVVTLPISWLTLPRDDNTVSKEEDVSTWALLKTPSSIIASLAILVSAAIWSILDPTLEPHLRQFNLEPEIIGVLFLIMAAAYAVTSPIWGWLADKLPDNRILLIPGFVFAALGLLLLGPSQILGFDSDFNELWLNILSLVLLGVSASLACIPTFDLYLDIAEKLGFEDDTRTYSIVAGLWVSMYALGDFIGPSVGGFLLDEVGFNWCVTYTAGVCLAMAVIIGIGWLIEVKACCRCKQSKSKSDVPKQSEPNEKTPLLQTLPFNTSFDENDILNTYPPIYGSESV
ncbi:hypothetical protein CHS0354_011578 [Potamilus streckersoni]|uniref:Major facilitator superfamily (MFS) profile domain-containing protein n=1 Tax=Potamilus streckersoni TaxID=2493646 RepID=A0AAE0RRN3_9BIVA|nr:hypothetical protein CHS0354_011578 [Potamilus streckersoni]